MTKIMGTTARVVAQAELVTFGCEPRKWTIRRALEKACMKTAVSFTVVNPWSATVVDMLITLPPKIRGRHM